MENTAVVLKALACEARLALVLAIGQGEHTVGDLQKVSGFDMSTVSKHISVLKTAGILQSRKAGQQVFVSVRAASALTMIAMASAIAEARFK